MKIRIANIPHVFNYLNAAPDLESGMDEDIVAENWKINNAHAKTIRSIRVYSMASGSVNLFGPYESLKVTTNRKGFYYNIYSTIAAKNPGVFRGMSYLLEKIVAESGNLSFISSTKNGEGYILDKSTNRVRASISRVDEGMDKYRFIALGEWGAEQKSFGEWGDFKESMEELEWTTNRFLDASLLKLEREIAMGKLSPRIKDITLTVHF